MKVLTLEINISQHNCLFAFDTLKYDVPETFQKIFKPIRQHHQHQRVFYF